MCQVTIARNKILLLGPKLSIDSSSYKGDYWGSNRNRQAVLFAQQGCCGTRLKGLGGVKQYASFRFHNFKGMQGQTQRQKATLKTSYVPKKIKNRKIRHGMADRVSENKNCPKFILGSCWHANRDKILQECLPGTEKYVEDALDLVSEWVVSNQRDKLTLIDLKQIFGPTSDQEEERRRYYCSRAFFQFLKKNLLQLVLTNNRVQKTLSYLFCLQKFTSRLANPELMHHLQFK